jgi:hypothetical protein
MSNRRRSSRAVSPAGTSADTSVQLRARRHRPTTVATSVSSVTSCAVPASKREISMRSSTSRLRWSTSWRTSRAAVAASPVSPGCSWRMSVTAVIAVSGVRSSWDTSPANCRARASICSSSPTLFSKAEAISLNEVTSWASSSRPRGWIRTDRSPPDMRCAARASRRTGSRTGRDAAMATVVIIASSNPASTPKKTRAVWRSGWGAGWPGVVCTRLCSQRGPRITSSSQAGR